ncbi:MAG TPA: ABC transporter ATP-binding protein, partial [Chitinophagaceae bacterium]
MKKMLSDTWSVLTAHEKRRFVLLCLLDIIVSIADIAALALLIWIVQFYMNPAFPAIRLLPAWMADRHSAGLIAVFVVLFGIKNIAAYLLGRAESRFIAKVAVRISAINLANYQHGSFDDFVRVDSSVLIRRIALQPFEFAQYILAGIQQLLTQSVLITLAIVAILLFNAKLFLLLLLILLPPVVAVFYGLKKRLNKAKTDIRDSNERSYRHLLDALKGFVEANVYGRNAFFMKRFLNERRRFSAAVFDSLSLQNLPSRVIEIFAVLGLFILILIANGTQAGQADGLLTIGAFMAAAYKIIPGMVRVINVTGQMRAYENAITDLVPKNVRDPGNRALKPSTPIQSISFSDVSFCYTDRSVLNDVSFTVTQGDFLGISGPSGLGKTTVFNLLLGFLEPASGQIAINGKVVSPAEAVAYWPALSYVRQQSFFIHDTIAKNITLDDDHVDDQRLAVIMQVTGITTEVFPEGASKVITENGKNISGGQQQRIAIARALYKNADVFLLDEAFNELDEASATRIIEYFVELSRKGRIILMITHDQ